MKATVGEWSSEISKRDIAYLLFKRKFVIFGVFLSTFVLVTIGALLQEPAYEATATLYIVRNLPPIAATSPTTMNIILDRKEVLNSEADLLASRPVAERVADILMARPPKPPGPPPPWHRQVIGRAMGAISGAISSLGFAEPPLSPRERVINQLMSISAVPALNSDFLIVSFESSDPEFAALVVNTFCEQYLQQRLKLFMRPGLQSFYDEQVERSRAAVEQLLQQAAAHKSNTGMVAPTEQLKLKLEQLATLRGALMLARTEVQEARERIAALTTRIAEQPANVVASRVTERNPIILELQKRRANLAAERASELNRFQEDSSEIRELDRSMERLQEAIKGEPETLVNSESTAQNTLRATLLGELYRAEADLTAKTARERSLAAEVARVEPEVTILDEDATELQQLNEALVSANRVLARYVEQREEARIATATDPGVTNAQLVSRAAVPQRPRPTRKLLIPAGAILGLFMGCVVAFVGAIFGQTLDRREDAERELGLPVLASLPELHSSRAN